MASICCSPPDSAPAGRRPALGQHREQGVHLVDRARRLRAGAASRRAAGSRATVSVAEDLAALGDLHEPGADEPVRRPRG